MKKLRLCYANAERENDGKKRDGNIVVTQNLRKNIKTQIEGTQRQWTRAGI